MSTEDVKEMVSSTFGAGEGVSIGIMMETSVQKVICGYISKSTSSYPSPQGPPPDPGAVKALLDNSLESGLGPSPDITH
jgi:hypothetical protein